MLIAIDLILNLFLRVLIVIPLVLGHSLIVLPMVLLHVGSIPRL